MLQDEDENDLPIEVEDSNALRFYIYYFLSFSLRTRRN